MSCIFCNIEKKRIILENSKSYAILDYYPISKGHALIIPKRHIDSIFHLKIEQYNALLELLNKMQKYLLEKFMPDAFNIGINDGEIAGQTIAHLHIHLIPRYKDDIIDPRGGIRNLFPEKAKWWK